MKGRWWAWPAAFVVMGVGAVLASVLAAPVDNDVLLFGTDLFGACAFQTQTGYPCASCGMTRSWVWMGRGEVLTALRYNVAGVMLLGLLISAAMVGAWRLLRRREKGLIPLRVIGWTAVGWTVVFLASWVLRLLGIYPLP